jgi:hypothetical protein
MDGKSLRLAGMLRGWQGLSTQVWRLECALLSTRGHTMRTKMVKDENREQEKSGIASFHARCSVMDTMLRRLSVLPPGH